MKSLIISLTILVLSINICVALNNSEKTKTICIESKIDINNTIINFDLEVEKNDNKDYEILLLNPLGKTILKYKTDKIKNVKFENSVTGEFIIIISHHDELVCTKHIKISK